MKQYTLVTPAVMTSATPAVALITFKTFNARCLVEYSCVVFALAAGKAQLPKFNYIIL